MTNFSKILESEPTPWRIEKESRLEKITILNNDDGVVMSDNPTLYEDVFSLIVYAVNSLQSIEEARSEGYKEAETRYKWYECYECGDSFKIDSSRMGEILDKDYTVCKNCIKKKAELTKGDG